MNIPEVEMDGTQYKLSVNNRISASFVNYL